MLLDTGVNPGSPHHLQEFSTYTGLPGETIPENLGFLRVSLGRAIAEWKQDRDVRAAQNSLREANGRAAEYAMAFKLLSGLTLASNSKGVEFPLVLIPELGQLIGVANSVAPVAHGVEDGFRFLLPLVHLRFVPYDPRGHVHQVGCNLV